MRFYKKKSMHNCSFNPGHKPSFVPSLYTQTDRQTDRQNPILRSPVPLRGGGGELKQNMKQIKDTKDKKIDRQRKRDKHKTQRKKKA